MFSRGCGVAGKAGGRRAEEWKNEITRSGAERIVDPVDCQVCRQRRAAVVCRMCSSEVCRRCIRDDICKECVEDFDDTLSGTIEKEDRDGS